MSEELTHGTVCLNRYEYETIMKDLIELQSERDTLKQLNEELLSVISDFVNSSRFEPNQPAQVRLKQFLDGANTVALGLVKMEEIQDLQSRLSKAEAEAAVYRKALMKFGVHPPKCCYYFITDTKCDCGLLDALKSTAGQELLERTEKMEKVVEAAKDFRMKTDLAYIKGCRSEAINNSYQQALWISLDALDKKGSK